MTQISATSQLAAMIRAQMAAQIRSSGESKQIRGKGSRSQPTSAASSREASLEAQTPASLQELVSCRMQAISPDTPGRGRAAFRIFMESLLLQEFGRSMANSPSFEALVSQVIEQMASDEELDRMMEQAGNSLVDGDSTLFAG